MKDTLSNKQVVLLSAVIPSRSWEIIGRKYMNIGIEKIISLKDEQSDNPERFCREIIRMWMQRNQGPGQKLVRMTICIPFIFFTPVCHSVYRWGVWRTPPLGSHPPG